MRNLSPSVVAACLLFLWLANGCSTSANKRAHGESAAKTVSHSSASSSPQSVEPDEVTEKRVRAYAAFAAGVSRQLNEDFDGMLRYFERSVTNDPSNEALALEVARRQLGRNRPQNAEAILRSVAARPDASGEVLSLLGASLVQQGKTNEALASYRRALSLEPAAITALQGVAQLLTSRSESGAALKLLEAAPRGTNVSVGYLVDLGELYAQAAGTDPKQKDLAQRRIHELYESALARKPEDPVLLQRIADRYAGLGLNKEAEAILKQLREKYTQSAIPSARLAELYLREGRYKEARAQLEAVSRLDPSNALPFFYLGLISIEEKQLERARNQFQHALVLNPSLKSAHEQLATVFLNLDQPEDAADTLRKARSQLPPDFQIEFLDSVVQSRLKHFDAAATALFTAETIAKTNNPAVLDHRFYFQLGAVLEEKGDHTRAEEYLKKSLAIKPDYDEALNHLGYMWAEAGVRLGEARGMIEKALKVEPDNGAYLDSLGWVLYKLGKAEEAVAVLEKANKMMKKPDATVLDHLADVYAALHRWKDAKETWKASLAAEANDAVKKKLDAAPDQP